MECRPYVGESLPIQNKANVNELEMRLIDEWGRFDRESCYRASGAVVSALVSVERSTL